MRGKLISYIYRGMYLTGIMLLLIGLLLSAVQIPVQAGTGAIWTTSTDCTKPAQDANQYAQGDWVYIRGLGWDVGVTIYWTIEGQPGGASTDPGAVVANGSLTAADDPTYGAGYFCVQAYQVQDGDDGTYNTSASYNANMKPASSDSYRVVGAIPNPVLALVKTAAPLTYDTVGDAISYTYVLTNSGNVPLDAPYTVTDDKASVTCPATPNPLPVGDSVTCTATYTITQADLDAGSVTNVATGYASYGGTPVDSNLDSETVSATQTPALTLDKTATETSYNAVGDVLHYSYLLTNSGNVTLIAPFTVMDNKTTVTCPVTPTSLAPLASITCTATYTITQTDLDAGSVTNLATGHGYFGTTPVDSNQDSVTVTATQAPALTLEKTVTETIYDAVGDVLHYSYLLTNSDNVTLVAPFTVTDNKTTVTCPLTPTSLAPLASITCTSTYTITQGDLDAGSVTNLATGHAYFGTTPVDSNQDSVTIATTQLPVLTLDKTVTETTYDAVGDVLHYSYLLTNSDNVTLVAPFTVTDNKTTVTCPATPVSLAPLASITCTANYTITQADLDASLVTNTAVGHGYFGTTPVDSNQDSVTVTATQTPALTLDKTVTETIYGAAGDALHYSYLLTNSGNVTLVAPFTVTDNKAAVTCPPTPASLAPLASITCTAIHIITQADLDAGLVTNTAVGHGYFGTTPVDSNQDSATVMAAQVLVLLDPYCTLISAGQWGMTWALENQSFFDIIFVWQITGGNPVGDVAPADSLHLLDTVPLGTYTVNIFWGDGQSDSLTAGLQLSDCETPPPPTPTTRPPTPTTRPTTPNNPTSPAPTIRPQPTIVTPVPTVEQPAVESDVLIPVTGLETSALLLLLGPFRQAILFTGLAFIGMAFIFQGMRKRFGG